mmetsp:Transcript_30738/g.51111  ORF Transcript_30738/g.51111 Transcript_30738/m.51111 type:complete len:258 (+) Transcript_30738:397-1170(+)
MVKMSTTLNFANASTQRRTCPLRFTPRRLVGVIHTNKDRISLTYGQIPVNSHIRMTISLPPFSYVLFVDSRKVNSMNELIVNDSPAKVASRFTTDNIPKCPPRKNPMFNKMAIGTLHRTLLEMYGLKTRDVVCSSSHFSIAFWFSSCRLRKNPPSYVNDRIHFLFRRATMSFPRTPTTHRQTAIKVLAILKCIGFSLSPDSLRPNVREEKTDGSSTVCETYDKSKSGWWGHLFLESKTRFSRIVCRNPASSRLLVCS